MTLETEMKMGLATLSSVEEMINTMQQQNNCVVKNTSDATKIWTGVATTIAATENEDCLTYFVKLNGISFISQWVQQVLGNVNYDHESIALEFLSVLMDLLEKLPVFKEGPAFSEIQIIFEKLTELKILNIEERARALSVKWKQVDKTTDISIEKVKNEAENTSNVSTEQVSPSKFDLKELFAPSAHKPERSMSCNFDIKEKNPHALKPDPTRPRSASIDCDLTKYMRNIHFKHDTQDLSSNGSREKSEGASKETCCDDDMEEEADSGGGTSEIKDSSIKYSDDPLDFEIDALEVARRVAIEVEREVVDYREPFCSPSPPECGSREEDAEPVNENVETTQEPIIEANKSGHVFDLNEEICLDESETFANSNTNVSISTPIATKGSPTLPVSPLQFEGGLGWKGSAATSAFRSMLSGQKRKAVLIEFDLNVAPDPVPFDPVEVSSKRAETLKLDLNQTEDEEPHPHPHPHPNMELTMSPTSSSSKGQIRDFDLNDNPAFFDVMGSHKKHENFVAPKPIFGSGPGMVMPYGNLPIYPSAYNGSMMGHLMTFPLQHHHANGNMAYMVDSRGAPVPPQFFSNMGFGASVPSMPQFVMGLNGAGTSQPGLDVNSMEGGNFKNFLMQGRIGLTEEQIRGAPQPQGSMNRKEANLGREPFNFMASWH